MVDLPHYDDIQVHLVVDARAPNGERRKLVDENFTIDDHKTFCADYGADYVVLHYENADVPPFALASKVKTVIKEVLTSGVKKHGEA